MNPKNPTKQVRVRFAPSPTGYLHIGGARTALYNWLFARQHNGVFILRIEDTDEVRSTDESVGGILESLRWIGLNWDEGPDFATGTVQTTGESVSIGNHGPYFQMERFREGLYQKYARKLINSGKAYPCYCSRDELAQMRKEQADGQKHVGYDGRCRNLTEEQKKKFEAEGRKPVIRFKFSGEGTTEFDDIIRGHVAFDNTVQSDVVILKANGIPTYNYVCVIDDHCMGITHVIRGDDHLSNTPKQIQIYKAFGWELPLFAHLSMILGQDGARLSKRHGATAVLEYRTMGYLPETLFNYLALLGWSNEESQQLFKKKELINEFSLERCSKNPAQFDTTKLQWMNGEYMREKDVDSIYSDAVELGLLDKDNLKDAPVDLLKSALSLEREKIKLLTDIPGLIDILVKDDILYDEKAVTKVLKKPDVKQLLTDVAAAFTQLETFSTETLEKTLREYAEQKDMKTSKVFHPIRVAVSGRTTGPGLFDLLVFLGKEKTIKRIEHTTATIL